MTSVHVRLIGGPFNGETRQIDDQLAYRGLTLAIPRDVSDPFGRENPSTPPIGPSIDTVEYRYHRRLEVDHGDGLGPQTALVEMRLVKPPQVRAAEKLLDEWRKHYGMQSIGPWPDL